MSERTYWLDLFSPTTWQEFLEAGGTVSGFRESRWPSVQQIKPGDYLLCYLTQVSRFIGVLEVTGEPFLDKTHSIWNDEDFPCRVKVEIVASVPVEAAVPISELSDRLSFFSEPEEPYSVDWASAGLANSLGRIRR